MVDKVALGDVFLRKFRFSPVIIFPPMLILIIVYWHSCRKEKRVKAGKLKNLAVTYRKSESLCMKEVLSDLLEWVQL
jgi:hypothetical protein